MSNQSEKPQQIQHIGMLEPVTILAADPRQPPPQVEHIDMLADPAPAPDHPSPQTPQQVEHIDMLFADAAAVADRRQPGRCLSSLRRFD